METVTVSPRHQVVIPKGVRQTLGIQPGQKLEIRQISGRIELILLRGIKDMRGFLKGIKTDVRRNGNRR